MSKRSWNSPGLHLPIAKSRLLSVLQAALLLSLATALLLVALRGYLLLSTLGFGLLVIFSSMFIRQAFVGSHIYWQQGQWLLRRQGAVDTEAFRPDSSSRILSFVVYLSWTDVKGKRERLWLFADSGPGQALRLLRVRLTLERASQSGVGGRQNSVTGFR